ncbi:hypothetical protein [uncultured Acinetobacter sp.]|uniref:hypothetical protein n=1 Tax=uncultured Acinetobacter sp. TaxID=165433 RepID=UPI0025E701FA|nr:hypothetical protein [uncultured Acinetobacter sp.]
MTTLNYTVTFHKTVLASFIGLCISSSCFALEAMSDEKLSDTTGEGIALLPQDTYMVFRGVGANENAAQLLDRTKDTGYINYVPVGPLSPTAADTNKSGAIDANDQAVGKADLFLYGLAISKANDADSNDINERVGMLKTSGTPTAINAIKSWGTATNPWLLKVDTATNVPTFKADTAADTDRGSVTYLALEAPAYETGTFDKFDANGVDAYKLKLGMWADAFVRNPNKLNSDPNQFQYGDANGLRGTGNETLNRENRLRLQAVWNNFSINGSKIQLFQTLNGATNTNGMSVFYNNTLGLAGVIRLNSGDSSGLTASSATANNKILRLSTQECGTGNPNGCTTGTAQGLLTTPALNATTAPIFDPTEGVFIYNLNSNIVLGSIYQPLILGSDGTNFSLELARIPNKADIYNKIYTDYDNPASKIYLGSTCNVYQCGASAVAGYQGSSATHSSITIGTTLYDATKNLVTADKSATAVGVSFGRGTSAVNLGSAAIDGMLIQHMKITTKGL